MVDAVSSSVPLINCTTFRRPFVYELFGGLVGIRPSARLLDALPVAVRPKLRVTVSEPLSVWDSPGLCDNPF